MIALLDLRRLLPLRGLLLAGVAALTLSACATNRPSVAEPDYSAGSPAQRESGLLNLTSRYKAQPKDKRTIILYAAALRQAGQADQAVSVIEGGLAVYHNDIDLQVAYAKALTADGRFDQASNVIDNAIDPRAPEWNALLVKGAILDQSGRNADARATYQQALIYAPNAPQIEANIGLSFAMTNDLTQAEAHLRRAVKMPGATSQIRQNLALVIGLEGRFDESRAMFAAELPPEQVESNMAYVRALLTQQNRWDAIKGATN